MPTIKKQASRMMRREQLVKFLSELRMSANIRLTVETVPKMRKTNNPYYGEVIKRSDIYGKINFSYADEVNAQKCREGYQPIFEALPRAWGARVPGTPWVEHYGFYYLEVMILKVYKTIYIYRDKNIPQRKLDPFLIPAGEASRQMLNSPIILRDYGINTIQSLALGGITYSIR